MNKIYCFPTILLLVLGCSKNSDTPEATMDQNNPQEAMLDTKDDEIQEKIYEGNLTLIGQSQVDGFSKHKYSEIWLSVHISDAKDLSGLFL